MGVDIRRRMRQNLRNLMPEIFLRYFRVLRAAVRNLLRDIIDNNKSQQYRSLIQTKYPDINSNNQNGLVLDLGANLGHFAAACQTFGFSTICVEPHPDAIKYLDERFKNNPRISLVPGAITSDGLPILLQLHPDHDNDPLTTSLSASVITEKFSSDHKKVLVNGYDFKNFFNSDQIYEIVKIDIEGAELFLFDDLIKYSPNIKRLLLETHSRYMLNTKDGKMYQRKLQELEKFIRENNLGSFWFTDWV